MAGGIWTPEESLLATVREFESFSSSFEYYEEVITPGAVDPVTGLAGEDIVTRVYYPVRLTQVSPQDTVTIVNGTWITQTTQLNPNPGTTAATLNGYYRYIFYDTIIYRDFNENIKTLTGSATKGTWEQLDMNDCYQMVEFIPDTVRYRRFEFIAEAVNVNNEVVSTKNYYVDVSDRNWTPGLMALRNAVQIIRDRGN